MNLSGGGAFLPNLAAPSLTAPAIDEYAGAGASGAPAGRNKGLIFLAVGAGAFLIVAAIGTATVVMHSKSGSAEPVASDKPVPVASYPSGIPSPEGPSSQVMARRGSGAHAHAQEFGAVVRPIRRVVGFGRVGRNVLPAPGDPPCHPVLVEVEARRFAA